MVRLLIMILVAVLGLVLKNSRFVSFLILSYIWIIVSFNTFSSDYSNNLFMYENIFTPIYRSYEPLFVLLGQLCSSLGLSFAMFRCVVTFLMLFFTWKGLTLLTTNRNVALVALLFFPLLEFASGLRSAIGFGISLYALAVMITGKRPGLLRYVLSILAATLFHYEYVVMLFFVLTKLKIKTDKMIMFFLAEMIVLVLLYQGVLYRIAVQLISHDKVTSWLDIGRYNHPSVSMDLLIVGIFIMIFLFISQGIKRLRSSPRIVEYGDTAYLFFVDNLKKVALLTVFLLPLLLLSFTFERLIIVPMSVCIIGLTNEGRERAASDARSYTGMIRPFRIWEDGIPTAIAISLNILFPTIIHGNLIWTIIQNNSLI